MNVGRGGKRIAVIGCGIIGLSTAVRLRESLRSEDEVTIFGKELPPVTTGDSAAGLWMPVFYSDTPEEKIRVWSKRTWDFISSFLSSPGHQEVGAYLTSVYEFLREEQFERPFWADIVTSFSPLEEAEVRKMCPDARSGFHFTSLMVEGSKMIQYLLRRFISCGGRCLQREVRSFDELVDGGFDLIVNCAGLGAKALCSDEAMFPIRGQIRMVHAPWIRMVMGFGDSYIIPKQDCVVLGGTHQRGDWNRAVRAEDTRAIVAGCARLDASLETAPVLREWTGLRPGRTEVRLEREEMRTRDGRRFPVVHNYGHGGSGLTVFWGCAEDACSLALAALGRAAVHRL